MTHGSRTPVEYRHRRTIFISALALIGACLLAATIWLSFCVPLAVENEGGLIEGLYRTL